ncbi:MAG: aminoacyl-histidine dipeptidase [Acutalibacteraceae bacterium]
MQKLKGIEPERVFHYFEEISNIPRGSGNMKGINQYCIDFAEKHKLKYFTDDALNVVILKNASEGFENADTVMLQGHLDIVCQKTADSKIDFLKDGLDIYVDGDFITANGTTLGADNGIAVAMILSILERDDICHPNIEAVFTTNEETGMDGAEGLDKTRLKSKKMINIDSEEDDSLTVSCAGGSDIKISLNIDFEEVSKETVKVELKGLKGGHSGIEINGNRVNANKLLGKVLNGLKNECDFTVISLNGGDKRNAIPNSCVLNAATENAEEFTTALEKILNTVKSEIQGNEPDFTWSITVNKASVVKAFTKNSTEKSIYLLNNIIDGVVKMSDKIDGLVETSLNLGILTTEQDKIVLGIMARSNDEASLEALEKELVGFSEKAEATIVISGHYPPWEYKENSELQEIYKKLYKEQFLKDVKVEAIHAGLECGLFSRDMHDLDCISIGPTMFDVHTVNERLSISSTKAMYKLLITLLENLK